MTFSLQRWKRARDIHSSEERKQNVAVCENQFSTALINVGSEEMYPQLQ